MRLKGAHSFFTEDDILSIAKANPNLDDALHYAILKVAKEKGFDLKDLQILKRVLQGDVNQSQIATEDGVTRMAISKRVAKIRSLLGPHIGDFIKRKVNKGET